MQNIPSYNFHQLFCKCECAFVAMIVMLYSPLHFYISFFLKYVPVRIYYDDKVSYTIEWIIILSRVLSGRIPISNEVIPRDTKCMLTLMLLFHGFIQLYQDMCLLISVWLFRASNARSCTHLFFFSVTSSDSVKVMF